MNIELNDFDDCIGIDEVGRGPLAGPVVSAAVWLASCEKIRATIDIKITDSKKMTKKQREKVIAWVAQQSASDLRYSVAVVSVDEIDEINILNAALLSMQNAYNSLKISPNIVLVDGNKAPKLSCDNIVTVIKGDEKILPISIASIIAKEFRDDLMKKLSVEYPEYCWEKNVGYGTKKHIEAIYKYGITSHHRKTFAPVSSILREKSKGSL